MAHEKWVRKGKSLFGMNRGKIQDKILMAIKNIEESW